MKIPCRWLKSCAVLALVIGGLIQARGADGSYRFIREIPIGGDGGWDYLSVDAAGRRLYVSHGTKIVVVNLDTDVVVGEIADTPGVHGFVPVPALGRGFSSNGRESKVSIVDLKTLQTLGKVVTGENPDWIFLEPTQQEIYTFNGRGHSATVIAAADGKVVATIPLPGKPETAVADAGLGRIFDNIEDQSTLIVIDAKTHAIVATWPIAPGEEATGLAYDEAHHRLFVGCGNEKMLMMDSTTGKVVASVPVGAGVDASAFDPGTQLAFSSSGSGTVTIAHEDTPEQLTVVQTLPTERGARTMTLDPVTHRIYLASAKFEPVPEPAAGAPRQRPKIVAGSFKVLVYGMEK